MTSDETEPAEASASDDAEEHSVDSADSASEEHAEETIADQEAARRNRKPMIALAIAGSAIALVTIIVLLISGGGGSAGKINVHGAISLTMCGANRSCDILDKVQQEHPEDAVGQPCINDAAGFSDIQPGTTVTIKNDKGAIIATGDLGAGEWVEHLACRFPFSVNGVPDAKFYSVEVSRRGAQTYSKAQLARQNYDIELTLDNSP